MKITAEFNSNEELVSFISTFGAKGFVPEQGVANPKATNKVVVEKKDKPVAEVKVAPVAKEDKYFYHPESNSYWMLAKGEVIPTGIGAESSVEISKEDYEKETAKAEEEPPKGETKITKEMVRELFGRVIKTGKQEEAKALTTKYGAARLPDVKEEDYAAIFKDAEELL